MACNCATDEQIKELYRRYGERSKLSPDAKFKDKLKKALVSVCVFICMVPIVPFLFLYVVYKALYSDDRKIDVVKFFRLNKKRSLDVREQQVI